MNAEAVMNYDLMYRMVYDSRHYRGFRINAALRTGRRPQSSSYMYCLYRGRYCLNRGRRR